MTITGLWRYGDWRHVATGCTALVPFNNELTLHYLNVAGKQATQCLCDKTVQVQRRSCMNYHRLHWRANCSNSDNQCKWM